MLEEHFEFHVAELLQPFLSYVMSANENSRDEKASIPLNITGFIGAIAGGFVLNYGSTDWTGSVFIYWPALILFVAPQVVIWSDSRRTKMAAWSSAIGAVCLLSVFLAGLIPLWKSN